MADEAHNNADIELRPPLPPRKATTQHGQSRGRGISGTYQTLLDEELEGKDNNPTHYISARRRLWQRCTSDRVLHTLALAAAAAPLALLLAFSSRLSRQLGENGCLPDGNYVLPFNSSVWATDQFFTITIPFTGEYLPWECYGSYSTGSSNGRNTMSYSEPCAGYTFAQVKTMDLAWDLLVGRCGQAFLIAVAYRSFSHALTRLMQQGQVGFDLFASTKFGCGSFAACLTLLKHAVGGRLVPVTRRAKMVYAVMALATVYILAVPTLVSAMTGYTSVFTPTVVQSDGVLDCNGKLRPVFGLLNGRVVRDLDDSSIAIAHPGMPVMDDAYFDLSRGYDWKDYYNRYSSILQSCSSRGTNASDCEEAQISSWVSRPAGKVPAYAYNAKRDESKNMTLQSPLIGMDVYNNPSAYRSHWACSYEVFTATSLLPYERGIEDSGENDVVCRAGDGYAWGFSFLPSLIVAILNLVFVVLMCWIALSTTRKHKVTEEYGGQTEEYNTLQDALLLAKQAQEQYGAAAVDWNARKTRARLVEHGRKGMTFVDESGKGGVVDDLAAVRSRARSRVVG